MKKSLLIISIILVSLTAFSQQNDKNSVFNEAYRPQFHFSPKENRMGNPISIVKIDTVYHLYYQHNPDNLQQGFVNWGHATSSDLLHWKYDGLSITQPENETDSMKFSPWWGSTTYNNEEVLVHSDQGSQFSSYDWQDFLRENRLKASMSRRGNCHDNAVAESFFQLLKRERIRRKTYAGREEARQDVFDYIEMFYNPKRRHSFNNGLSPVECEKQYFERLKSV